MGDNDTEQTRYLFSVMAVGVGIVLSLTVIGAVIGVPLGLIGVALFFHTWWKDFDDEPAGGSEPA